MTIPSSQSLSFEVKSTGSELAFIRVPEDWDWEMQGMFLLSSQMDIFGRLQTSLEDFGILQKTSDFFGNLRK